MPSATFWSSAWLQSASGTGSALPVRVDDAADRDRIAVDAARGERRVGLGHRQWRHLVDAEGERLDLLEHLAVGAAHAELPRDLCRPADPDLLLELGEVGVDRGLDAGLQRVGAVLARALVAWGPTECCPARHRSATVPISFWYGRSDRVAERDALLQRRRRHEDLERRACLEAAAAAVGTVGRRVELDLALAVTVAAAHRHRLDRAGTAAARSPRRRRPCRAGGRSS